MRKLRIFESISIDGYFTDSRGDMSFAHSVSPDPKFAAWVAANASSDAALLFGRKTYEMMWPFWTSPAALEQMPEVAKGMNLAKKYLVSKTVEPKWNNTERLEGELAASVGAIKASDGPPIVVLGSGSVAAALGEAGLVDEYQFVIVPVALGSGRTVFSEGRKLRLASQLAFENGNVVVTYAT